MIGNSTTMDDLNKSRRQNQIPFKCEICDKEFKSNNSLIYHFNSTHKMMGEHKCNICQNAFNLQSQLTSHVKNSHGNKMRWHNCDLCGKSFSQSGKLKKHINIVHECDSCEKVFFEAENWTSTSI